jgi:hypothetical protein
MMEGLQLFGELGPPGELGIVRMRRFLELLFGDVFALGNVKLTPEGPRMFYGPGDKVITDGAT